MTPELTQQITRLADDGAILFLRNVGEMRPLLVGALELLDARRLYLFEAFGENEFAGHVVEFATADAPHGLGVEFRDERGELRAYLCPIAEADFEPDMERNLLRQWSEWKTKRPGFADFIQRTREALR